MLNRNYKIPYDIVLIDYITTSLHFYLYIYIYPITCHLHVRIRNWFLCGKQATSCPLTPRGCYCRSQELTGSNCRGGFRPLAAWSSAFASWQRTTNLPSFLKNSSIPIQAGESEMHVVFWGAMSSEEELFFSYLCLVLWRIFGYILTPQIGEKWFPTFQLSWLKN